MTPFSSTGTPWRVLLSLSMSLVIQSPSMSFSKTEVLLLLLFSIISSFSDWQEREIKHIKTKRIFFITL
jgi:hypothetical protein